MVNRLAIWRSSWWCFLDLMPTFNLFPVTYRIVMLIQHNIITKWKSDCTSRKTNGWKAQAQRAWERSITVWYQGLESRQSSVKKKGCRGKGPAPFPLQPFFRSRESTSSARYEWRTGVRFWIWMHQRGGHTEGSWERGGGERVSWQRDSMGLDQGFLIRRLSWVNVQLTAPVKEAESDLMAMVHIQRHKQLGRV